MNKHNKKRRIAQRFEPGWANSRDGKIAADFEARVMPTLVLIDRQGTIRIADAHIFGLEEGIKKLLAE